MSATGLAVFASDVDVLGGSERQALLLSRALARRGYAIDLITSTSPGLLRRPRQWITTQDGYRLHRLPRLLVEPVAGPLLAMRRRSLRGLYAVGLMMGAIAARLGRALELPVVVKLAGAGDAGDMVALSRLPAADRTHVLDQLRGAHIVCMTDELAEEAMAAGLRADRLVRITNGVDLEAIRSVDPVRPCGASPTVLFLGRLAPEKGLDVLLRAFAGVTRAVPGVELVLAGEGPERRPLEALAAGLGLATRVRFLGRREDPFELLRGATVVALPSHSEGMSNTLLEALAAGCVVVASSIGANVEVAEGAALLVPPDDVEALARGLVRTLTDPELRETLGEAARARGAAFGIDAIAGAHLALFDRLGPPPPARPGRLALRLALARAADLSRAVRRAKG